MPNDVFQLLTTGGALIGGWLFKVIWDTIKEVRTDVKELSDIVHSDFARKEDFKDSINELRSTMQQNRKEFKEDVQEVKQMLGKIFDRLNQP
jgi:phenylalanyl-tRNA synthetase alpha subunit